MLYRKDTPLDGSAPLWLYGYGSYGITIPAGFNTNILSLVDRGFIYAIAHIRGGQDKGYRWYTQGKREKKQNSFRDFISAARHLIEAGYTRKAQIVAQGGSAGGMLMGAVANMAPDLFKIFCQKFHSEVNRLRTDENTAAEAKRSELDRIERRIRRIVDVIAEDDAPVRALKQELIALEARQITLQQELAMIEPTAPLIHPDVLPENSARRR